VIYHPALPALLGFVALLMIAVPSWALIDNLRARERGVAGVGIIVEKEERPFKGTFHCWVEFAGRRCRVPINKETWRSLRTGEPLHIRYDPQVPGNVIHGEPVVPPSTMLHGAVLLAGFGIAIVACMLWLH
jgi:hypothetical protein